MNDHKRPEHGSEEHSGGRGHRHGHGHNSHGPAHSHQHGVVNPDIAASGRGLWVVKWSFVGLFVTAALQIMVFYVSNSIGLLADTIHNFADAGTAVPLGIAFLFTRMKPTQRFPYGYGRVEDLAGMLVVLTILASAGIAAYESIHRLVRPQVVTHLGAVAAASVIGFLGNEGVAIFRIRVGKEIGSAALVADGQHARIDGWTSLAVLFGAVGVYFGYSLADPIVGLVIMVAILGIVWQSGKDVFTRALDGVEPGVIDEIRHAASHVPGVATVTEVRARWLGHRLHAEVNIAVEPHLSVAEGHAIATEVNHQLLHHLQYLSLAVVHVDPSDKAGESHHQVIEHSHDGLPPHSH